MRKQVRPLTIGAGPIVSARHESLRSTSTRTKTGSRKSYLTGLDTVHPEAPYLSETSGGIVNSASSLLNEKHLMTLEISHDCLDRLKDSDWRQLEEVCFPFFSSTIDQSTLETPTISHGPTKPSTMFVSPSVGVSGLLTVYKGNSHTGSMDFTSGATSRAIDSSTEKCKLAGCDCGIDWEE